MPLGDGTGPPNGTGPMTGRARFAPECPGVTTSSSKSSSLLAAIIGALSLLALIVIRVWKAGKEP